jgi:hypothetical protein
MNWLNIVESIESIFIKFGEDGMCDPKINRIDTNVADEEE